LCITSFKTTWLQYKNISAALLRTLSIEACAMALKTRTAGTRHPRLTSGVAR